MGNVKWKITTKITTYEMVLCSFVLGRPGFSSDWRVTALVEGYSFFFSGAKFLTRLIRTTDLNVVTCKRLNSLRLNYEVPLYITIFCLDELYVTNFFADRTQDD